MHGDDDGVERPDPAGHRAAPSTDPSVKVVDLVRRTAAALDAMWRESLLAGQSDAGMRLGEASHCVHRALIALDPLSSPGDPRRLTSGRDQLAGLAR